LESLTDEEREEYEEKQRREAQERERQAEERERQAEERERQAEEQAHLELKMRQQRGRHFLGLCLFILLLSFGLAGLQMLGVIPPL
jgi:uncharacterized membrane protein YcjF (UPF0283 family)